MDYVYIYIYTYIYIISYYDYTASIYVYIYIVFANLVTSWIHQAIFLHNLHQAPDLSCCGSHRAAAFFVSQSRLHCRSRTLVAAAKSLHLQFAHLFLQKNGGSTWVASPKNSHGKYRKIIVLTVGIFKLSSSKESSDTSPKIIKYTHMDIFGRMGMVKVK